jgi:hypothetical protein
VVEEGEVEGGLTWIFAKKNTQSQALVITTDSKPNVYTVPVTTVAKISKTVPTFNGVAYSPVPIPNGVYSVGNKPQGTTNGYPIDVSVSTPMSNNTVVKMNDFLIHATEYSHTWGCVGVQKNWDVVNNTLSSEKTSTKLVIY